MNIEERQANLLWWLTDDVLVSKNAKISIGKEAEVRKSFIKILRKGIKRLLDPQGQGQSFSFITNDEFLLNSSLLRDYFTNYKDFNKAFSESMYRKHKAPNILDIIKEISTKTKSKNKRLYIIFEDFSLDENESRMIFNYIVADSTEGEYNTTFILAGTPKNLVHLDAEGTFRDRRHLYETNYSTSSEREQDYVPTFSHSDPVDFVEKYLGFLKTYEGSLKILNDEYQLSKNSNFCNQCKKCESLEDIIIFPFNKIFIKNLYEGSKFEKRKPRTLITLVGNLLNDYISGKPLFNSTHLKNIDAPDLVYEGKNQNYVDFTQWFGLDRSLFNYTFPDGIKEEEPFPSETDDTIVEEPGKKIIEIPDELKKLKNNIHKFKTNPNDSEVEDIQKINFYIFHCLNHFMEKFISGNNRLSSLSRGLTVFLGKGQNKILNVGIQLSNEKVQLYIDLKDYNKKFLKFLLSYGYFLKNDKSSLEAFFKTNLTSSQQLEVIISYFVEKWEKQIHFDLSKINFGKKNYYISLNNIYNSVWIYLSLLSNPSEIIDFKVLQRNFKLGNLTMDAILEEKVKNIELNGSRLFDPFIINTIFRKIDTLQELTKVFASYGGIYLKLEDIKLSKCGDYPFNIYKDQAWKGNPIDVRLSSQSLRNYWVKELWPFFREIEKFIEYLRESYLNSGNYEITSKNLVILSNLYACLFDPSVKKELLDIIQKIIPFKTKDKDIKKKISNLKDLQNYLQISSKTHMKMVYLLIQVNSLFEHSYLVLPYSKYQQISLAIQLIHIFSNDVNKNLIKFNKNFNLNYEKPSFQVEDNIKDELEEIQDFFSVPNILKTESNISDQKSLESDIPIFDAILKNLKDFNTSLKNDELNQKLDRILPSLKEYCLKYFILNYNFSISKKNATMKQDDKLKTDFISIFNKVSTTEVKDIENSLKKLDKQIMTKFNTKFENITKEFEDLQSLNSILKEFSDEIINLLIENLREIREFPTEYKGTLKEAVENNKILIEFRKEYELVNQKIKTSFANEVYKLNDENAEDILTRLYVEKESIKISDIDQEFLKNIKKSKFNDVLFISTSN